MNYKISISSFLLGCSLILSGCNDNNSNIKLSSNDINPTEINSNDTSNSFDSALRKVVAEKGLTGDPAANRDLPDIEDPMAQLGMQLFFSKGLGGEQDAACVTCHHPMLGGSDKLSLPIGAEADIPDLLGPGRTHSSSGEEFDGGPTVPRNSPTTFNVALWDSALFHDGRLESLSAADGNDSAAGGIRTPDSALGTADPDAGDNLAAAQARFPVTSPEEMRGFEFEADNGNDAARNHLARRLQGTAAADELGLNQWLGEFQLAFNQPTGTAAELITYDNIAAAIGEYERSQVFVDSPWRSCAKGDPDAISEEAKQGALLFFRDASAGGANCASCHGGDFFTDEKFHTLAMPQIGRGKDDDNGINNNDDFGRFRETGEPKDKYAFRTPSLLNVEVTGPWTHAGAYTSLEAVVRHHLNPEEALNDYDYSQLDPSIQTDDMWVNTQLALDNLQQRQQEGTALLQNVELSDVQVKQLVAFLKSLTDPCVKDRECMAEWIPDANDSNPDGLRVQGHDENGDPL